MIETYIMYYLIIGFIISIIVVWGIMYKDTVDMIKYSWINIFGTFMFMVFITWGYSIFILILVMDYLGLMPGCGVRDDK